MKQLFRIETAVLGGVIPSLFEWSAKGQFVAAAGSKRKVAILDKSGKLIEEISLPAVTGGVDGKTQACSFVSWDPCSDQLAILPLGGTFPLLYNSVNREIINLDTGFKNQELTALSWSSTGSILAVGTVKGNLLLYNSRDRKQTQVMAKHTKRITMGIWNKAGVLALAGEDKMITFSDGTTGR